MIDITRYLTFIIDNKLTQTQFTFMYILYYAKIDPKESLRLIRKYKAYINVNAILSENEKKDLVERGFVTLLNNNSRIGDFVLTQKSQTKLNKQNLLFYGLTF